MANGFQAEECLSLIVLLTCTGLTATGRARESPHGGSEGANPYASYEALLCPYEFV